MRPMVDVNTVVPFHRNGAGPLVLVKKYERPDTSPGGIIIPDSYRDEKSWKLWELVRTTPEADEVVGVGLRVGDILETRNLLPVDSGRDDREDGRPLFFLAASDIWQVIQWGNT